MRTFLVGAAIGLTAGLGFGGMALASTGSTTAGAALLLGACLAGSACLALDSWLTR